MKKRKTKNVEYDNDFDMPVDELNTLRNYAYEYMSIFGLNKTIRHIQDKMDWGRYLTLMLVQSI